MTTTQIRHILVTINDVPRAPKSEFRKAAALAEASDAHGSARMALSQHTRPNGEGRNVHSGAQDHRLRHSCHKPSTWFWRTRGMRRRRARRE